MFLTNPNLNIEDFLRATNFICPQGFSVAYFITPQQINVPEGAGYVEQKTAKPDDESITYTRTQPIQKQDSASSPAEYSSWQIPEMGRRQPTPNILPDITEPEDLDSPFVKVLSESKQYGTDIILLENYGPFPKNTLFHCVPNKLDEGYHRISKKHVSQWYENWREVKEDLDLNLMSKDEAQYICEEEGWDTDWIYEGDDDDDGDYCEWCNDEISNAQGGYRDGELLCDDCCGIVDRSKINESKLKENHIMRCDYCKCAFELGISGDVADGYAKCDKCLDRKDKPKMDCEYDQNMSSRGLLESKNKIYTIVKTRKGRETETSGTLEELVKYFGYTLECGNSWNRKIPRYPKTIKSLMTALYNSTEETQGGCYDRNSYRLKDEPILNESSNSKKSYIKNRTRS